VVAGDIDLKKDDISASDLLANKLESLRQQAVEPLTESQKEQITELQKYGVSLSDIAKLISSNEIAVKGYLDAQKALEIELKNVTKEAAAWQKVLENVNDAVIGMGGVLDTVDGTIVDWAEHLLASGASAKTVAEYYGLTDDQVKALEADLRSASVAISDDTDATEENTVAQEANAQAIDRVSSAEQRRNELAQKAIDIARDTGGKITTTDVSDPTQVFRSDPDLFFWLSAGASLAQAVELKSIGKENAALFAHTLQNAGQWGPRVPGYAGGVTDAPGGWATVGEHGPETMYVPKGASIFANGSGPGVTVYNTFHIVDTESNIAKRVSASITRSIMAGRQLV
jgi:hypothetical protein